MAESVYFLALTAFLAGGFLAAGFIPTFLAAFLAGLLAAFLAGLLATFFTADFAAFLGLLEALTDFLAAGFQPSWEILASWP